MSIIPAPIETRRVVARYVNLVADTALDPDDEPDVKYPNGLVVFTRVAGPSVWIDTEQDDGTTVKVTKLPIEVPIDPDTGEIKLPHAPSPGVRLPVGQWRVQEVIGARTATPWTLTLEPDDGDTLVDLHTQAPITPDPTVVLVPSLETMERAEAAAAEAAQFRDDARAARDTAVQAAADATGALPMWNSELEEYDPTALAAWMLRHRDGLIYGVEVPKGLATECVKVGANAGVANPVPGVIGTPAIDPYVGRGPFFTVEVNGFVDPQGVPHVTAFQGDPTFSRTGGNGDVWILAPNLFWRYDDSDPDVVALAVSDVPRPGFAPQPKGVLPSGERRPYMLYAKYAMSRPGGVGAPRSISGEEVLARTVSHNSLITICANAASGYSGKSYADDWYVKLMFLLKYATKNSQSVFGGCTSHSQQYAPVAAETDTNRVVLTAAQAALFPIGSAVMLGTNVPASTDRQQSQLSDIVSSARVMAREPVGENVALVLDQGGFDTDTAQLLSTAVWRTGGCDLVVGDGSPIDPRSNREPFTIQGIELGLGMYEILGDVMTTSDGVTGWQIVTLLDSRNAATSVTEHHTLTGQYGAADAVEGSKHPLYPDVAGEGLLFGAGAGASTSTGMSDSHYLNRIDVSGNRAWLSLGVLSGGSAAGLWCVFSNSPTSPWWHIGSRLSGTGRGGE